MHASHPLRSVALYKNVFFQIKLTYLRIDYLVSCLTNHHPVTLCMKRAANESHGDQPGAPPRPAPGNRFTFTAAINTWMGNQDRVRAGGSAWREYSNQQMKIAGGEPEAARPVADTA